MTDLTIPAYISRPEADRGRCVVVLDYPWSDPVEVDHGPLEHAEDGGNVPPQLVRELRSIIADIADGVRADREEDKETARLYSESRGKLKDAGLHYRNRRRTHRSRHRAIASIDARSSAT